MAKMYDAVELKTFAETFLADPILKMSFNSVLRNAPTVDAVEVVHGRWIRRGNERECSQCKFIYYSNHDDFNYCPNCGAKMDGGV